MRSSPALAPDPVPDPPAPPTEGRLEDSPAPSPGRPAAGSRLIQRDPSRRRRMLKPLPLRIRVALLLAGGSLILIGLALLVLPGPGFVGLVVGAALLSLVSELIYVGMWWVLRRWPVVLRQVEGFRLKTHRRLRRYR